VVRWGVSLGDKTVRAWSWPLASIWCQEVKISCNCTSTRPRAIAVFCLYFLRHCATSRKVAGSIPDGVIGIFHWHNPSNRTMTLGLTQPLTEMNTRNISWGVNSAGA